MAAVYIDTDLNRLLGVELQELGNDVLIAVDDPTRVELPDPVHLIDAALGGRVLLTQSKADFLVLHQALAHWTRRWAIPVRSSGIVIIDSFRAAEVRPVAEALDAVFRIGWQPGETIWRYNHRHGWQRGLEGSRVRFAGQWFSSPLAAPAVPSAFEG